MVIIKITTPYHASAHIKLCARDKFLNRNQAVITIYEIL
jgi:hypothetical protein